MLGVAKDAGIDGDLLLSPFVLLDGELAKRGDQMACERCVSHRVHRGHRVFELNSRQGEFSSNSRPAGAGPMRPWARSAWPELLHSELFLVSCRVQGR